MNNSVNIQHFDPLAQSTPITAGHYVESEVNGQREKEDVEVIGEEKMQREELEASVQVMPRSKALLPEQCTCAKSLEAGLGKCQRVGAPSRPTSTTTRN